MVIVDQNTTISFQVPTKVEQPQSQNTQQNITLKLNPVITMPTVIKTLLKAPTPLLTSQLTVINRPHVPLFS